MKINKILLKPVLTEKATGLVKDGVYTFEVDQKASKSQIRSAIEGLYQVKIGAITTQVRKGKIKKVGRRLAPKTLSDHKLAFIRVKTGSIDLFPKA